MNRREFVAGLAALAVAPDAVARALGGTPVALVTADLESHVVAIDIASGRVLRRIATEPGPRSIETVRNDALVAHTEHSVVSLIDGARLRVRAVVDGFEEPRYAVAWGDYAFITDSRAAQLVVLDVARARIVGRVELGGAARHLSFEPSGRIVWAALGNKADRIAVVDVSTPQRPRLVRKFTPPFLAHDVGFGPGRVWVTAGASRELAIYDRRGRMRRFRADAPPQHVTFVGGRAFVTSGDEGTLRVHSAADGRLLSTTRVPLGSFNVQECGQRGSRRWVLAPSLSKGTLCIADERGRLIRRVHAARSSHDACFVISA